MELLGNVEKTMTFLLYFTSSEGMTCLQSSRNLASNIPYSLILKGDSNKEYQSNFVFFDKLKSANV